MKARPRAMRSLWRAAATSFSIMSPRSWSVDETLSVSQRSRDGRPALDLVTVQWSIIAESLNNSRAWQGRARLWQLGARLLRRAYSFTTICGRIIARVCAPRQL